MYSEFVKKEMKEMKELLERIERLNTEAKLYNGEEAMPMLNNIEKLQEEYNEKKKDIITRYEFSKEKTKNKFDKIVKLVWEKFEKEKKELEEPYNKKIEEISLRIERLNKEKALYEKDEAYIESVQNNIDKLEEEIRILQETEGKRISDILKAKEDEINSRIESTKKKINTKMETVRNDFKEINISVEPFSLEDKKELEEKESKESEVKETKETEEKGAEVKETETKEETKQEEAEETKAKEPEPQEQKVEERKIEKMEPVVQYEAETIPDITIKYLAKTDEYELIDKDRNERYVYARTELVPIDKEMISEKMDIPMENLVNMNSDIVRILRDFDRINGTHKLAQYRRAIIQTELSKKEMKEEMYLSGIKIDYDLRGLYKKGAYTPEEIQEILENANNAKQIGSGKVRKGIYTSVREKVEKAINRIKNTKLLSGRKTEKLPEPEEMDEYIADKTNREYWNSINEKEYKKAVRQANNERNLKEKLEMLKAEKNYYEMMNDKEQLVNSEYLDSIDEDYKKAVKEEHNKKVLKEKLEMIKAEEHYEKLMNSKKQTMEKEDEEER